MNHYFGLTDIRRAKVKLPQGLLRLSSLITVAQLCIFCLAAAHFSAAGEPPHSATGPADPKKGASKPGAAGLADAEIPLSVFVMPTVQKEGRDPFFPNSMRPYASARPKTTNAPPVPDFTLILNGITPGKLVMINGRSFSEGEEGEVNISGGKKRLRCIKIKEDSAVMELVPEGERRELRLRPGLG